MGGKSFATDYTDFKSGFNPDLIRVIRGYGFMVSCLCPFRDYRAPVSAPAVDVRASAAPAVVAGLALRHARLVAAPVLPVAQVVPPEVQVHVPLGALHVAPDHGLSAAQQVAALAAVALEPELAELELTAVVVHCVRGPGAHHAPGSSVPSHDQAHCLRASSSRDLAGTSAPPESCS